MRYSVGYADFWGIVYKGAVVTLNISRVTGPNVTKIVYNVDKFILFNILKSELQYCNSFSNGSATKEIGPGKTPINWLPRQRPLKNQKSSMSKPLHPSTNPEILVKIGPLVSEPPCLKKSTIKRIKKIKK